MVHPVFKDIKSLILYLSGWIPFVIIHLTLFNIVVDISLVKNLWVSVCNIYVFALLGLSLWFMVYYDLKNTRVDLNIIIYHIIVAAIFITIWHSVTHVINMVILSGTEFDKNEFLLNKIILGFVLYLMLMLTYYTIKYNMNLRQKLLEEEKLQNEKRQAELLALKNQINPHFLFNSLNSVSSLIKNDGDKARDMIIHLSEFLRYSLKQKAELVPLKTELEQCRKYLEIEKVRFGNKIVIKEHINAQALEWKLPPLILQPLYENAIKHGVYESTEPVEIETTIFIANSYLEIHIVNSFDPDAIQRKGEGVGQVNIQNRLELIYKEYDLLKVNKLETTYHAKLKIPAYKKSQ